MKRSAAFVFAGLGLMAAGLPSPLAAQAPASGSAVIATLLPAPSPRFQPAPWWMGKQVVPAIGQAQTELRANRASLTAGFQATAATAALATQQAAAQVRALGDQLAAYGPDRVRSEIAFQVYPIYPQYRDKAGRMQTNNRADKITAYSVRAHLSVEVRDVSLLEQVYAQILAALPGEANGVTFDLEPDNDTRLALRQRALDDAARRAQLSAQAAGAQLGPVKLIDPSGAACRGDGLLAGAPPAPMPSPSAPIDIGGQGARATLVLVDGQRTAQNTFTDINKVPLSALGAVEVIPDGASAIYGTDAIAGVVNLVIRRNAPVDIRTPLQPPMISLKESTCVVYSLA